MSSFDYELKDQLRRAGAPVIDEPDQDIDEALEWLVVARQRITRQTRELMAWCVIYGCAIGILATLAVQHIFGGA